VWGDGDGSSRRVAVTEKTYKRFIRPVLVKRDAKYKGLSYAAFRVLHPAVASVELSGSRPVGYADAAGRSVTVNPHKATRFKLGKWLKLSNGMRVRITRAGKALMVEGRPR
jgi:hypothetical protein